MSVSLMRPEDQRQVTESLTREMAAYPPALLNKTLKTVAVVGRLAFNDVDYGGTYRTRPKMIILAVFMNRDGVNVAWLAESFHHELSSFLLKKGSFPEKKWIAQNASEKYRFTDSGMSALKSGAYSNSFDPQFNEQGYVSQYGSSDFENDVNTMAGAIMGPRAAEFWQAASKYPRLMEKGKLLLKFYKKLDSDFQPPSSVPSEVREKI